MASYIGVQTESFQDILSAKKPLTAEIALMLEAALDIPADSLMQMQTKYNMQTARQDKNFIDKLNQIKKIAAVF